MGINLSAASKALKSLQEALDPPPKNDRERDGAIQRFEYTFELIWKSEKKVLSYNGIESNSPRSVIRDLGQQGWIDDVDEWLGFLEARNLTSHTYEENSAEEVFESAKRFYPRAETLLHRLKKEIGEPKP